MIRINRILAVLIMTVLLLGSVPVGALADDPPQPELTLEEAAEKALSISKKIKRAEKEKDIAWEWRGEAQDAVSYTPIGMVHPMIEAAYSQLLKAELGYQIASKQAGAVEDDIKQLVVDKYCAVLDAKEKEVEAEIALEKAKWDHYASTFKMQFGTEAPIMKDIIDSDVEQKKGNLIIAQHNLNKAYTDLNILVGITPDARPVLTTEVVYEPLEITGINSEVGRAISSNVNVWAALQNVIIEKEDLRMTLKPYEIEKMEIEVAELTADGAKEELEKGLRGLYHDILSLEEAINASKGGVKAAETGLKAAEVRYDVGMATEGDLLESKATLAIAKKTQAQLKYQHATATAAYRNLTGREVLPTN